MDVKPMTTPAEQAQELYSSGYSCSEAIIRAFYDQLPEKEKQEMSLDVFNKIASTFSGGMGGSGCLCGAISGAQIVLGVKYGRTGLGDRGNRYSKRSAELIKSFKEKRKVTCCRALNAKYEMGSPERVENCRNIIGEVAEILHDQLN